MYEKQTTLKKEVAHNINVPAMEAWQPQVRVQNPGEVPKAGAGSPHLNASILKYSEIGSRDRTGQKHEAS